MISFWNHSEDPRNAGMEWWNPKEMDRKAGNEGMFWIHLIGVIVFSPNLRSQSSFVATVCWALFQFCLPKNILLRKDSETVNLEKNRKVVSPKKAHTSFTGWKNLLAWEQLQKLRRGLPSPSGQRNTSYRPLWTVCRALLFQVMWCFDVSNVFYINLRMFRVWKKTTKTNNWNIRLSNPSLFFHRRHRMDKKGLQSPTRVSGVGDEQELTQGRSFSHVQMCLNDILAIATKRKHGERMDE